MTIFLNYQQIRSADLSSIPSHAKAAESPDLNKKQNKQTKKNPNKISWRLP